MPSPPRALPLVALLCAGGCSQPTAVPQPEAAPGAAAALPLAGSTAGTPAALAPGGSSDPTQPGFHRLGQNADCALQAPLAALSDCRRLSGRALGVADTSREAFDGDTCTTWNSGEFPPQGVSVDLIDAPGLDGLLVYPEMTPVTADVTHVVEISDDGETYRSLAILTGVMTSGEGYALRLPKRIATRYLRVRTTASPSWVAWREIVPLLCHRPEDQPRDQTTLSSFEDLGAVDPERCHVPSDLLGPSCERVGSRSMAPADSERAVFDGTLCSVWDSGELPPRAVTGALIRPTISGLLLAPATGPEGEAVDATHVVEISANGIHYRPIAILSGTMISGHIYTLRWSKPAAAVFVRVRTTAAPARVAWREIAVFACDAER